MVLCFYEVFPAYPRIKHYICKNEKLMKYFYSLLALILLSLFMAQNAVCVSTSCSGVPIDIGGGGSGNGSGGEDPNGASTIPITCEYSESTSELVFCFLSDFGDVTITVTNFLNGEVVTDTVNSQFGIVNFPISGDAEFYYISILTLSGATYHGQFAL